MTQKIKKILISVLSLTTLAAPVMVTAPAFAAATVNNNVTQQACTGANAATSGGSINLNGTSSGDSGCVTDTSAGLTLGGILKDIINILSIIIGAVAVIMIIVGGFKYVTSGGNDSSVASAKNTIIYAIVGLIIVALAQVIVHYVLNRLAAY